MGSFGPFGKGILFCLRGRHSTERYLLGLCGGSKEQMWRLMMYERRRAPGISRREAVRRAIESYRRDHSR